MSISGEATRADVLSVRRSRSVAAMPGPVRSRTVRAVLIVAGFVLVGIAFVGIVVPLVPTTPLVLLAAFAFSKSSERFDRWLVENRWFGGIVRDWRAGVGFTVAAKTIAVGAIVATFTISILFVADAPLIRTGLLFLGLAVATYVVTRPTKREIPATER